MADEALDVLKRIDTKLTALLEVVVDQYLRNTDLAKPRPRSIDRMLADAGMSGVEVGRLLGKSPQAVSQALAKDAKPAKRRRAGVAPTDAASEAPTQEVHDADQGE